MKRILLRSDRHSVVVRLCVMCGLVCFLCCAAPAGGDSSKVGQHHSLTPAVGPVLSSTRHAGQVFDFSGPERSTLYDTGTPTAEEQYFLELINRARADAWAEASRLKNTTDTDVLGAYSYFNVDLDEMERQFQQDLTRVLPPLSMNAKLLAAARLHSQDMYNNVFQGHDSSSNPPSPNQAGDSPGDRITRQGYTWQSYGENVYAYSRSVFYGHAGFEVDWGSGAYGMQDPPGHRQNIHSSNFREVGVGVVTGENSSGSSSVGPMLVTEDFAKAQGSTPFITGVVYADTNLDVFYGIGEGVGSVTVTVAGVTYYAVTPDSGGYSIPVPSDGSYQMTFSGSSFGTHTTNATVSSSENVKIDLILASLQVQPPSVVSASDGSFSNKVMIIWNEVSGATAYQVWRSTTSSSSSASQLDQVNSTSYLDTNVTAGTTYYYWLKSVDSSSTSDFSSSDTGYASASSTSLVPVYRLYSYGSADSTYEHLWTTSETEKDTLDSWPSWEYEGVAWYAYPTEISGTTPLYRLYASSVKQHHYTIDTNEYASLSDGNASWMGEGVQYFVYSTQAGGTLPVYRFYHSTLYLHHFTISENEKNQIDSNPSWGYTYEGIGFYVNATNTPFRARGSGPKDKISRTVRVRRNSGQAGDEDAGMSCCSEESTAGGKSLQSVSISHLTSDILNSIPVPGDFDGDGLEDTAYYEESTGIWYVPGESEISDVKSQIALPASSASCSLQSTDYSLLQWGGPGFAALAGDYDGDGLDDLAVYHSETGRWFVRSLDGRVLVWDMVWGGPGLVPVVMDPEQDGLDNIAVIDLEAGAEYVLELLP